MPNYCVSLYHTGRGRVGGERLLTAREREGTALHGFGAKRPRVRRAYRRLRASKREVEQETNKGTADTNTHSTQALSKYQAYYSDAASHLHGAE